MSAVFNSTLKRYLIFYLLWLLLIKFLFVIWETIGMDNKAAIILETVLVFSPFVLVVLHTVFSFFKVCFSGSIKNFSLDYAELAIVAFVLFYIGYFHLLEFLSDKYYNILFYTFNLGSALDITAFKYFWFTYLYAIFQDTDALLYFMLLPLYVILLLCRLKIEKCAQKN